MRAALVRTLAANWLALGLGAAAVALLAFLHQTDRDLELYKATSHRYRFHAIPVALSQVYHGRAHDYTASRKLAHRFQNTAVELDHMMKEVIASPPEDDTETYFWTADDRGLSDYVGGAFQLYGPRTKSLTKFYFLLLGGAVAVFFVGYWRTPVLLAGPVMILFALTCLAQVLKLQTEIPFAGGTWKEEIALYESRLFEVLGLVSCLHLALLAAGGRVPVLAWVTAVPQAAFLTFLLHCRSSLGWEFLALFVIAGARITATLWLKWRSPTPPHWSALGRPLFVIALLVAALVGLKEYKRATYHAEYFRESGSRTFWHNALMGYNYHPRLRLSLPIPEIDDRFVVALVLKRMREANDPRLGPGWEMRNILNSLGGHSSFDWPTYEAVCKEMYLDVWKTQPSTAAMCYARYKTADVAEQTWKLCRLLAREAGGRRAGVLVPVALVGFAALVYVFAAGRRDEAARDGVRTLARVGLVLTAFALIPGMAFYAATTTLGGFYVLLPLAFGLFAVRAAWRLTRSRSNLVPQAESGSPKLAA